MEEKLSRLEPQGSKQRSFMSISVFFLFCIQLCFIEKFFYESSSCISNAYFRTSIQAPNVSSMSFASYEYRFKAYFLSTRITSTPRTNHVFSTSTSITVRTQYLGNYSTQSYLSFNWNHLSPMYSESASFFYLQSKLIFLLCEFSTIHEVFPNYDA